MSSEHPVLPFGCSIGVPIVTLVLSIPLSSPFLVVALIISDTRTRLGETFGIV